MYIMLFDSKGKHRLNVPVSAFAQSDNDGLLLLELTGVDTANRACWANIVKHRPERTLTDTNATFIMGNATPVRVIPATKYHKLERPNRLLLLHNSLTRFQLDYLLGGSHDQPSPWFASALQNNVPLPMLDHWLLPVWKGALARRLVTLASTIAGPVNVWRINHQEPERWLAMATEMIKAKLLTETPR